MPYRTNQGHVPQQKCPFDSMAKKKNQVKHKSAQFPYMTQLTVIFSHVKAQASA